ncbi:MAG: glycosyl transferase [Aeromicrobium sp.]|nr:glycosyl transferase [Aeromicrobium sp.]
MSEPLLMYTAADVGYLLQAQVLVRSLSFTQDAPLHLIVFGSGWSPDDERALQLQAGGHVTVEIRRVDADKHRAIRLTNNFPLATAYNVLAPDDELPDGARALYVDADVVVRRDLAELFEMTMQHPVGATVDAHVSMMGVPSMWRPWREESVDPRLPYLNTGALLVDVDRWRTERMTPRIVEYLQKYDLPCVDQDAINLVVRGGFDRLRPAFNSMPYHVMKLLRNADLVETDADIAEGILDPAIIHFHRSFLGKPWTRGCTHPARHLWTQLATEAQPRWRRAIDVVAKARGLAAEKAKMSVLDERAVNMPALRLVPAQAAS